MLHVKVFQHLTHILTQMVAKTLYKNQKPHMMGE